MRDQDLPRLLRATGDDVGEPDLARSTWERGLKARRRRLVLTGAGGLGALALTVSALTLTLPGQGPSPAPTTVASAARGAGPEAAGAIELPLTASATLPGERAREVWRVLYTACLEEAGYDVSVLPGSTGGGLVAARPGVQAGERDRDLQRCRAELVLDAPVTLAPPDEPRRSLAGDDPDDDSTWGGWRLDQSDRMALTARYQSYLVVDACLHDAGLATSPPPPAEDFILTLALDQLPPWHPYVEAAGQGRYEQARTACPLAG